MDKLPFLGRCTQCNFVLFTDRPVVEVDDFNGVKPDGSPYLPGAGFYGGHYARCPQKHKVFKLKQIQGTYSKDHKCDTRCLNARGHKCTCSCGGMNHGRGFAVAATDASEVTAMVNPCIEVYEASEKQLAFIRKLLDEREIPTLEDDAGIIETGEQRRQNALGMIERGEFTKRQASKTIEWLLTLPRLVIA